MPYSTFCYAESVPVSASDSSSSKARKFSCLTDPE